MITKETLARIPTFVDLPEDTLDWLIANGEELWLEPGEKFIEKGAEAIYMVALIEGRITFMFDPDGTGEMRPVFTLHEGGITGMLPFSRMKEMGGDGLADKPCHIFQLHKKHFKEMEHHHEELVQRLVSLMTDRARTGARAQQEREKLMALGKLSAGLAHELNNPAAAIRRTASELKRRMESLPAKVKNLLDNPPDAQQVQFLMDFMTTKREGGKSLELSMMERSDLEADLEDWLDDREIEASGSMVESFIDMGISEDDLDKIEEKIQGPALQNVLQWLDGSLSAKRLAAEIEDAAGRISDLVGAIKAYSHVDRAATLDEVEVGSGIKSTITMLAHKFKVKNIEVKLDLPQALPKVTAYVNELNQVWTNLLDNAVDALDEGGRITIEAKEKGKFVQVGVIDNGPGIPADIQTHIFEPFFTTKKQGQGSGLGLDIVRRMLTNMRGDIWVDSQPGRTEFVVCLPKVNSVN